MKRRADEAELEFVVTKTVEVQKCVRRRVLPDEDAEVTKTRVHEDAVEGRIAGIADISVNCPQGWDFGDCCVSVEAL
jgi:hypothetical protein